MKHKPKVKEQLNSFQLRVLFKDADQVLPLIIFTIVALLLLIGPFNRGLFFPRELLMAQILVFALLTIWGFYRIISKDNLLIESPLDICLIILLLAYFISFFFAAHKRDALQELLKIASYLVVYFVTVDFCRHWKISLAGRFFSEGQPVQDDTVKPGIKVMLHLLFWIGFTVTIASLGSAAGHWSFPGAYLLNRIGSPMGYANTAAAYLMAVYLLTLALAPLIGKAYRMIYLSAGSVILLTVLLTFSRGAWLLLPPLLILLILTSAPGERLRSLLNVFATALPAVPAAFMVDPALRSGMPLQAWLLVGASALCAAILGLIFEFYLGRSKRQKMIVAGAFSTVFLIVVLGLLIVSLIGPLSLGSSGYNLTQTTSLRQVVTNVEPNEDYKITFEINATHSDLSDDQTTEEFWGLRIIGELPDLGNEELFNYRGGESEGWQDKTFNFKTTEDITRIEVQIFNRNPENIFEVRSVILKAADKDHKLNFALSRILPQRFYDRVFSPSRDRNVDRRFELYRDSIKLIKDYPLTGVGGGGWAYLQYVYQEQPYNSREVHNHFLQVWVEAGVFAFLSFVGLWFSFTFTFIRNILRGNASPERWQYWSAAFIPAMAIGAHSVIDWSFSMAAVGFYLFVLLGVGKSLDCYSDMRLLKAKENGSKTAGYSRSPVVGITALALGIAMFIYTLVLLSGMNATVRSQELMSRGNIKQAETEMIRGIRLDPFRADNYHNLGLIYEQQAQRLQSYEIMQEVIYLSEMAYSMEPFNPLYVSRYGGFVFEYIDAEDGLHYIDKIIELRPFVRDYYIQPSWSRLRLMEFYADNGNFAETERLFIELLSIRDKMEKKTGGASGLNFIIGRAHHLVGNISEAIAFYEMVSERNQFYDEAQNRVSEILGDNRVEDENEEDDDNEN